MADRNPTASCSQQPVQQMQQQSTAGSGEQRHTFDLQQQLRQLTDAAVVDLQRQLHQQTDAAVVGLQRQLHQQDAAVVDLQRQLQQHLLTIRALEAEKADLQSQLRAAAEKSQERIQTLKQLLGLEEGPHGLTAVDSSTEGVPAKIRRLDPPGRIGSIPNETDLSIANKQGSAIETLPLDALRCILSYCGLRSLLTLRRVSKQFRTLSDGVPKEWINLSDLFNPVVDDLCARIAILVHYAGTGLVGFTDFTGTRNYGEDCWRGLPLLLSVNCPNLKTLRLPLSQSDEDVMRDLWKYAAYFLKLEEITAVSIPSELVLALPALRRINGTVKYQHVAEEKVKELARKLSRCQHIEALDASLTECLVEHFCEKDVNNCPEIRGLRSDLNILNYCLDYTDNYQQISCLVNCVGRMFPEVLFIRLTIDSEDFARCLSPIAHRFKSVRLYVDESWTFEETPSAFSKMVCLEELTIRGVLAEEYRDFFSFLPKLEQLEHLSFYMEEGCTGWSCLMGMLAPSAPFRKLSIKCRSFPDDFHKHFKALAASGVQLCCLDIFLEYSDDRIGVSFLRPIFDTMPCIEKVVLSPCASDVFEFLSRTLTNLAYLSVSPVELSQILALAEERIEAGRVVPKLTVQFSDASSVGLAQIERLQLAGMELKQDHQHF